MSHPTEPIGLRELEAQAKRADELMEKHNPKSEGNFDKVMDLLRIEYNLLNETSEQAGRGVGERSSARGPRSHHNWGARLGRARVGHPTEPTGLRELEAQARRAVELMEKHNPKSDGNFDKCMDLLRLQYNLNFIVLCEKCGGPHVVDELLAPER